MNRLVFILILGLSLAQPPVAHAGVIQKARDCAVALGKLSVETGSRVREFLAARGLMPYEYGDEAHAIEAVPKIDRSAWVLFGMSYSSARREFLKAMTKSANWERLGTEVEYGTYLEKPSHLEGRTIAGLIRVDASFLKKGSVRAVVGKVISVNVSKKSKSTGEALQFEVKLLTPEGIETVHLPGLREVHALNLETEGRIKKLLLYVKGMSEGIWDGLTKYAKEVRKHPVRVLLRPRDLDAEKEYPWNGFLRKETTSHGTAYWVLHPVEYAFYRLHSHLREARRKLGAEITPEEYNYFLIPSPVRFLRHHTLTKGFSALVKLAATRYENRFGLTPEGKELFDKPMEPGGIINTVLSMGLFYVGYSIANAHNDAALVSRRQDVLDDHEDEWKKIIPVDYFLRMVQEKLASGKYGDDDPEGEAVEEAFLRLHALDNYYYYMMDEHDPDDMAKTNEILLKDEHTRLLFGEVPILKESGPRSSEHLTVPKSQQEPASDEEVQRVMAAHHRYLSRRPILQAIARGDDQLARILGDRHSKRREQYQATYREILEDPYYRQLIEKRDAGDLSPGRLEYLLMEAADTDRRFSTWEVFGAQPVQDGRVVSKAEIRSRRLDELENNAVGSLDRSTLVDEPAFDHNHLISRYGGDLTSIHMIRQTSPLLRSSGYLSNYVTNGRQYRGFANGEASRFQDIMTPAGGVTKQVRGPGYFSESFKMFSRFVIAYDVANRAHQWLAVEDEVMSALENPYASRKGNVEVGTKFIDQVRQSTLEEPPEPVR